MTIQYYILAVSLIIWCAVHSALISITATHYLKKRLGGSYRFYRLFYNSAALLTLLPIGVYLRSIRGSAVFAWEGYLKIIQIFMLVTAVLFFFFGAKRYDMLQFLGIRQVREGTTHSVLTGGGEVDTGGILGFTRHPWYAGALLLIWSRDMDVPAVITNVIFTGYLIIGTLLEERKLTLEFWGQYLEYQRNVSMFFPFKWLIGIVKRY